MHGTVDRAAILAFIAANPARANKRDIAKHFGLKNEHKPALKALLMDLEQEGLLLRQGKRLQHADALPPVMVLAIVGRDDDGGLIATPASHDRDESVQVSISKQPSGTGRIAGIGDRVLARLTAHSAEEGTVWTAKVLKVLDADRSRSLGVLRTVVATGERRVAPIDRKQPEYKLTGDAPNARDGDLIEVEPLRTGSRGRMGLPSARFVARIGSVDSEKAVSMIAIHDHGIPHVFPDAVLVEAENLVPQAFSKREDWRDLPFVTIDPVDAKDHDDAVFARPDTDPANAGGHVIDVAIADVAAHVLPGSAMDAEALKRGNSVYFPDRVIPMLPERISNDLCSLREGEDRPALAMRIVIDKTGAKRRHSLHRVMIRSCRRLAYQEAQAAFDGAPGSRAADIAETVLKPLHDAYLCLKRARERRAPIELDLPERKLTLDETGRVAGVSIPDRLDAHKLIEEMMIQANVAAAETLERKRVHLVYRVHQPPSLAKQESLRDFLKTLGMSIPLGATLEPARINQILANVRGTEHEEVVNQMVLRSQSQAIYAIENHGHFGLNLGHYAHFTSPIRRYADLMVHRALVNAAGLVDQPLPYPDAGRLAAIAEDISVCERRAMAAERDTVDRLIAHHLADRVGDTISGTIGGVSRAGLFVRIGDMGADGFVPVSTLGDEYFHFDEAAQAFVGATSGRGFRLADAVDVRIKAVQPLAGAIELEMVSKGRDLRLKPMSFHKSKRLGRAKPNSFPRRSGGKRRR